VAIGNAFLHVNYKLWKRVQIISKYFIGQLQISCHFVYKCSVADSTIRCPKSDCVISHLCYNGPQYNRARLYVEISLLQNHDQNYWMVSMICFSKLTLISSSFCRSKTSISFSSCLLARVASILAFWTSTSAWLWRSHGQGQIQRNENLNRKLLVEAWRLCLLAICFLSSWFIDNQFGRQLFSISLFIQQ